jgi:heavy metal translocating P-type ATPase
VTGPTSADLIAAECDAIKAMLLEKNAAYGDSALDPLRIFSKADPVEQIKVGDILVVRRGDAVPVDGVVVQGSSMVDESALTGEALPVAKSVGAEVMSGSISKDGVLEVRATRESRNSKYQRIVQLVRDAEERKAPFVRLADRYSVWFTGITFVMALGAWIISGDPVRSLAVLVVATPCPLILATPIAFAAGISRCARRGIIAKNGGALEKLGEAKTLVFDKTGTLTLGSPTVSDVSAASGIEDDVLRIAASLEQLSSHVLAQSVVASASKKKLQLAIPQNFQEVLGQGVTGDIGGKTYFFGRREFLHVHSITAPSSENQDQGTITVLLADERKVIGSISFSDHIRPGVRELFTHISELSIKHVVMLTGDKRDAALRIAKEAGIPAASVKAEMLPEDKLEEVERLKKLFPPVIMVGDGVNDAPALVAADVGIAMGAHGGGESSEAGDIVIMVDKIERVGEALIIARRVMHIALQSIGVGIGLSIGLMILAVLGYVRPVFGAMAQEVIDVVVILNALRVLLVRERFAS